MSSPSDANHFCLLNSRLIIIPTTLSIKIRAYREMYGPRHSLPKFCEMAFGRHLVASYWSPEFTLEKMTKSNTLCWEGRGMGDMAAGLLPESHHLPSGRPLETLAGNEEVRFVDGEECHALLENEVFIDSIQWAGYVGVRDATSTWLEPRMPDQQPFPPWQEMVELRYGIAPAFWGKGIGPEVARIAMNWAVEERGVKRFIAETLDTNAASAKLLKRVGFVETHSREWWVEDDLVEWERVV